MELDQCCIRDRGDWRPLDWFQQSCSWRLVIVQIGQVTLFPMDIQFTDSTNTTWLPGSVLCFKSLKSIQQSNVLFEDERSNDFVSHADTDFQI